MPERVKSPWLFHSGTVNADGTVNASSPFKGLFRRIDPSVSSSYTYPGLEILGDVVDAFGHASATVRMEATIKFGTQSDTIQAEFPVTVRKAAGDSARVAIESLDSSCFAIREKGDTCQLIARVYLNGILSDPKTLGATYEWFRLQLNKSTGAAEWATLGSGTYAQGMHVCEVSDEMIDTTGVFKVTVSGLACGDLTDTQTVTDLSDPYVMDVEITPADLCIYEDKGGDVRFTPFLRTGSGAVVAGAGHFFTAMDAAGNILDDQVNYPGIAPGDPHSGRPNGHTFVVTPAMCIQAGGDVSVAIEATTARFANAIDTSLGAGAWRYDVALASVTFKPSNASAV